MIGAGVQVAKLFRAQVPPALEARHDDRSLEDERITLLIAEGYGPTAVFVESLHRVDKVAIKGIAAHFTIGDNIQSGGELKGYRLVDRAVLPAFEFGVVY